MGGLARVTVVVKVTFALIHDAVAQFLAPIDLARGNDDSPDLAPYLPCAGITLMGHASAPRGQSRPLHVVRLAIFRERPVLDKTLHVYGHRTSPLAAPQPFQHLPLVWELAHGGPGVEDNPAGIGPGPGPRGLPHLVDAADPGRPAGYGPVPRSWGARRRLLGHTDPAAVASVPQQVLEVPEGFDFRYFHAAPPDQHTDFLQGNEWIVLDGMHSAAPRLQTRLPSVRAAVRWYSRTPNGFGPGLPLEMLADTLAIDADRQVATVTWRGTLASERPDMHTRIAACAGLEIQGRPVVWPEPADMARHIPVLSSEANAPALTGGLPFMPRPPGEVAPAPPAGAGRATEPPAPLSEGRRPLDPEDETGPRVDPRTTHRDPLPFTKVTADPEVTPVRGPARLEGLPFKPVPPAPSSSPLGLDVTHNELTTSALEGRTAATAKPALPFSPAEAPRATASIPVPGAPWSIADPGTRDAPRAPCFEGVPFRPAPSRPEASAIPLPGAPWSVGVNHDPARAAVASGLPWAVREPEPQSKGAGIPLKGAPWSVPLTPPAAPGEIAPPAFVSRALAEVDSAPVPDAERPPVVAPPPLVVRADVAPELVVFAVDTVDSGPGADVADAAPCPEFAPGISTATDDTGTRNDLSTTHVDRAPAVLAEDLAPVTPAVSAAAAQEFGEPAAESAVQAPVAEMGSPSHRPLGPESAAIRAQVVAAVAVGEPLRALALLDADLRELDLASALLSGCRLDRANLAGCTLSSASLVGAVLASADLSGATLAGADLTGADLSRATLAGADLTGASLNGTNLSFARGPRATFARATGRSPSFAQGTWDRACFDGAELTCADFSDASLAGASFEAAVLTGLRLDDANGERVIFTKARMLDLHASGATFLASVFDAIDAPSSVWDRATLDGSSFREATLTSADLSRASAARAIFAGVMAEGANLNRITANEADFTGAHLANADLRQGTFTDAVFDSADLKLVTGSKVELVRAHFDRADLSGAMLRSAKLTGADFSRAVLEGADLRDADLEGATMVGTSRRTAKLGGANLKGLVED